MPYTLTTQQLLDSPEISILIFHNVYPEGKQGGVEIIQHGERVATNGDLRLEPAPGQWAPLPKVQQRSVENGQVSVRLAFDDPRLAYTVRVWADGEQVQLAVDLDQPLPAELAGRAGFNIELLPTAFFGRTYFMDGVSGAFPRQANGPAELHPGGLLFPGVMAKGQRFAAAPEDDLHRLEITTASGELLLMDGRNAANNGWFIVRQLLPAGVTGEALRWTLTPARLTGWRRAPQILASQVGYHPAQDKVALIELDPHAGVPAGAELVRILPDGSRSVVVSGPLGAPEKFLRCRYARFDFTQAREPGVYQLRCGGQVSQTFRIAADVYRRDVWQPTLETFFPNQMCHVRVEEISRVWHGACHLEDAVQAPVNHEHFDGYRQHDGTDTPYAPGEHIPGLDRGGWHDAGDYDLAAGSQANTTYWLALAREVFGLDTDQTTVRRDDRLVLVHVPDGVPDVVQQVAHGVDNLLGGYHAAGHSLAGIIEATLEKYTHLGDAATMMNGESRWAFTNHNTALEYQVAAALAASARVLKGYEDELAAECLATARQVWEREHAQEPDRRPSVYVWNDPDATEILAAVELLIATGEQQYASRLVAIWPNIEKRFGALGWAAARALPYIEDEGFHANVRAAAQKALPVLQAELDASPFGLPFGDGWLRANRPDHDPFAADYHAPIWGIGWSLQSFAVHYYFLLRAFPDLFDREPILRVLNYVLGVHPAGSQSLVSGVGAQSLTMAYGTNRAEWSYTPGGIASGPALLRPDFIELLDPFPWLWQQKEYVIGGAATYIFLVLAADALLNP